MNPLNLKILLAASNPKEVAVLSRHLRRQACRVSRSSNWHDCLKRLKKDPDFLLLDLSLKGAERVLLRAKNGSGKKGKKNENGIPVLVFDHKNNLLKELKALRLGADGYVRRPQLKEELISAITPLAEQKSVEKKYESLLAREGKKRQKIERELTRITDFSEKIASNVPFSILIVDEQKKITYVNRNFCRAMGQSEEWLLGRALSQIFPEILFGPIELTDKVESILRGGHATPRFSMGYRRDSYTCRVLPVVFRKRRHEASSRQAMILIENISELKSLGEKVKVTEERYRALFENSPDGILVTRPTGGRILEANRQAEKFLQMAKSQLRRKSLRGFFSVESRRILKKKLEREHLRMARDLPDLAVPLAGGKSRTLTVTASPIQHKGEEATLCILKDVTEKRLLEEQIRQTEKMSFLGQFTAGAAHEINNPLAIISSHTQYLVGKIKDRKIRRKDLDEINETLNLVNHESQYCGRIIKNLLAYTHTQEAVKEPVDLETVVTSCIKMVKHQLQLSNVKVDTTVKSDLPCALGDANLLQQVLMNIIWNAQGAMPKGGKLNINVTTTGKPRHIVLSVRDTGVGISRQNIEKIFTPFFTTKEVGKGTGLGLWVVQSIIEEHKGKIEVKSWPGKGAVFTIRLPICERKGEKTKGREIEKQT